MGPLVRADFDKLYANRLPFIRMLIGPEDWPEVDNQWERYFQLMDSDRMREEFLNYAGLGNFEAMGENDPVHYDSMVQGPSKVVLQTLYGLGFQIGYLAAKHDLDGIVKRFAPELGRSLRMSVQTLAMAFWNGAFDVYTSSDGQFFFSAAHPFIRGGGTFANTPSVVTVLGHTALETGLISFRRQKDFMGNPQPLPVETMLIAPELEPIAHELTQSRMRHDTATHAESFVFQKVKPESSPFLTIPTAWYLLSPKEHRKIFFIWNIRPETSHGFDFDRTVAKTKTLFAAAFVGLDPRGTYASKGAA